MNVTILAVGILIVSFIGAFGELIINEYKDRKSKKEFEKRQEKYKKMI